MSAPEFITFGCRLNTFESTAMQARAEARGLDNVTVINSCAVTGEAVRQARQAIRRARRQHPERRIIVTGCAAQVDPREFAAMPEVDAIIGNDDKLDPAKLAAAARGHSGAKGEITRIEQAKRVQPPLLDHFGTRARAFVQIQNGCDYRCTFCIIPFGRGPSRSLSIDAVTAQIQRLVDHGSREVVLTGVDITSWGADLPDRPPLGRLVSAVLAAAPELPRLRLTSLDPAAIDGELMALLASEPRLLPHLHLSLQAGDNMILKRMKRRHDRESAIDLCASLRKARPDMVFGADFIAGFPTETEAMFANTMKLVEECHLDFLHVFPFSPRPGTPAARMAQLPRATIKARAARLRYKGQQRREAFYAREQDQTRQVLVEENRHGHTEHFASVTLDRDMPPATLVSTRISGYDDRGLHGEVI
jgi:threonylcarbamoyladenosine tRNA methylthiotransferase MtaB